MAVPPHAMPPEKDEQDDDDFTFPTPPPPPQFLKDRRHLPCSSSPPVWLHLSSSPIRRSFSAADCPASPWRDRLPLSRCRSPALSDYIVGEVEEEEEERMDSLWEDLNDDGDDLFLAVSRRRSVGGADAAQRARRAASKESDGTVLGASRSSRRRAPGLVTMMRALKKMLVAHKGKNRVLHRDEQSTIASASASPYNKR